MLEKDGLADRRFVVNTLTAISITTGPDLVEEGTIDLVHLGAVDLGESLGHYNVIFYKGSDYFLIDKVFILL